MVFSGLCQPSLCRSAGKEFTMQASLISDLSFFMGNLKKNLNGFLWKEDGRKIEKTRNEVRFP